MHFTQYTEGLKWVITNMPQCSVPLCLKKQPKLNAGDLCKECYDKANEITELGGPNSNPQPFSVDDNQAIGETTFAQFKQWMRSELQDIVKTMVKQELIPVKKDIEDLRKENKVLTKKLADVETKLNSSIGAHDKKIEANQKSSDRNKTVADSNLKYLINLDRNARRKNVMFFGIPEDKTALIIDNNTANDDSDKLKALIQVLGCSPDLKIIEYFRLGKPNAENPEKVRPLKVRLLTKQSAEAILENSSKLKDLKDKGYNIYVKPDKTKSEQTEFQRLGKKKEELEAKYPTAEGGAPRVTLSKGSLKVDGVEVDKYEPKQTLF